MNGMRIPTGKRPNYFRGQLLLEDDFLDEQRYHIDARRRHNLMLHDWGVVRGLAVTRAQDKSVRIGPGAAIDETGREIVVDDSNIVDLNSFRPHDRVCICLAYEESSNVEGSAETKRVDCYAAVNLARNSEPHGNLILATVALDDQGNVNEAAIEYSQTKYARLAAGSITAVQLHDNLRKGWMRLPFRPDPLVNPPQGEKEIPPPFRVGATEALSPSPDAANERDQGAGGTMAIPIPPSVTQVTRLRIAGSKNEGEISILLVKGGWDASGNQHMREVLVEEKFAREPFMEVFNTKQTALDPECHTLSLWVRGTRRTSISLVAVEFGY